MLYTSAWPLVCFLVVFNNNNLHRFSSCCIIILSSSLGYCTLISIWYAWRSSHYFSLSRHHDASPYGNRGQGTRLKFSSFRSAFKLSGLKIILVLWVLVILPRLCVVLWLHYLLLRSCQVSQLYQYRRRITPLCTLPVKHYYIPCMVVLHSKLPHILRC